jgi:ribosomal 50S subunit-recycling heat shock protein
MSPLGLERHPSYGAREGVIVGMGSPNSMRVKFDDRVTVQAIHRDYLVRVANAAQQTNQARRAS